MHNACSVLTDLLVFGGGGCCFFKTLNSFLFYVALVFISQVTCLSEPLSKHQPSRPGAAPARETPTAEWHLPSILQYRLRPCRSTKHGRYALEREFSVQGGFNEVLWRKGKISGSRGLDSLISTATSCLCDLRQVTSPFCVWVPIGADTFNLTLCLPPSAPHLGKLKRKPRCSLGGLSSHSNLCQHPGTLTQMPSPNHYKNPKPSPLSSHFWACLGSTLLFPKNLIIWVINLSYSLDTWYNQSRHLNQTLGWSPSRFFTVITTDNLWDLCTKAACPGET